MSTALADDWGLWTDYGMFSSDFKFCYTHVMTEEECTAAGVDVAFAGKTIYQNRIPAAEYNSIPWAQLDAADPRFMQFIVPYISTKQGVLGAAVAEGPARMEALWPEVAYFHNTVNSLQCFKMGHIKHHGVENGGQVGALQNMMFNRDPMNHTHSNFYSCGLPLALQKEIGQELFNSGASIFNATDGSDGVTANSNYGPMNMAKAALAAQAACYIVLANSLTTCNWTLPIWVSPFKSRNYRGDATLEAQAYAAVTGDAMTQKGLETVSLRILTLFRALTARYMEYYKAGDGKNMRVNHDKMNDWMFDTPETAVPFAPGNNRMDRDDMELARDLLYDQFGWDRTTGMPTQAKLAELGLGYVATALAAEGLLP
jgi:aldehyde:ferredoxin oxidoreductase